MSSTKRRRRAPEKELPGENPTNLGDEPECIEGHDAGDDDDGFFEDVEEPLSAQRHESEENPSIGSRNYITR